MAKLVMTTRNPNGPTTIDQWSFRSPFELHVGHGLIEYVCFDEQYYMGYLSWYRLPCQLRQKTFYHSSGIYLVEESMP
jgi:hypothetical protein